MRCSDSSWDESSDEESGGEGWIKFAARKKPYLEKPPLHWQNSLSKETNRGQYFLVATGLVRPGCFGECDLYHQQENPANYFAVGRMLVQLIGVGFVLIVTLKTLLCR